MRSLSKRGANFRAVTLDHPWQKKPALPLWRRGLIEIWYRQSPDSQPSLQGPYYGLSIAGASLAARFIHPAPRGISGAGEVK
jgi:hypothetical protein